MFLVQIGGQFDVCLLLGLVLLEQSRLQALKEFVYLGREVDTEAASTSFWLWKMVTQLENLMARKTGCLTLWRMLGAVM